MSLNHISKTLLPNKFAKFTSFVKLTARDAFSTRPLQRRYSPENSDCFDAYLVLCLGEKGKKGSDDFSCRIATPKGLAKGIKDQPNGSIIHGRQILVVSEYSYDDIWEHLQNIVKECQGDTWVQSCMNLRKYFEWEYDDYNEQ